MPKRISPLELTLGPRPKHTTLTRWFHEQLRGAILDGRLKAATRLPASRDFASQYKVSRGTIVTVFEQLEAEGFLTSKVGSGTWVNKPPERAEGVRKALPALRGLPSPLTGLRFPYPAVPFRSHEPALSEFPIDVWARLGSRVMRHASISLLSQRDPRGYLPLREALVEYLRASRGVSANPDQIVIVSGAQQALDILARVLLNRGDSVWMEDPGYFGATTAFRNAGIKIVPVPVDHEGIDVTAGYKAGPNARGVYLTPAHQFPLGVMMSLRRRLAILEWARTNGAFVIEDDYDGEYRFEGHPVPVLQSLDQHENVILIGSFNKLLFSSLRLGYIVLPPRLVAPVLAFRFGVDQNAVGLEQAILAEFLAEGHMGRHIRGMRELYAGRLKVLINEGEVQLKGILEIAKFRAGLYTVGLLRNGMSSRHAEIAAAEHGIETMGIDRFRLRRRDIEGLVLGFAAFDGRSIKKAVSQLAVALSAK